MYNPENERIKRTYFNYLREAKRQGDAAVDAVAASLARFERYTNYRPFKAFHIQQATGFKRYLGELDSPRTGQRLSKATLYATLTALRNFFHWLAGQPGFRSRLSYGDADYFNLSEKETRIAKAHRESRVPTIEQIEHVLRSMPSNTDIEKRNRAVVAFTLLTGARDGATASLKLDHVDVLEGKIDQDAREVNTKFSKTFTTWFFPVPDDVRQIFVVWVEYLRKDKLWGREDPLFPATEMGLSPDLRFVATGLARKHWSSAAAIRAIFKQAFTAAGLPYFNPHSFRKTLAQFGERRCRTPEQFKAWSQNLGHEGVMTTFVSYGQVSTNRQAELIRGLDHSQDGGRDAAALVDQLIQTAQQLRSASTVHSGSDRKPDAASKHSGQNRRSALYRSI